MKNKKLTYILLPAAFLIWGYIAFSIYNSVNKDEYVPEIKKTKKLNHASLTPADSFELLLNYRDPFLGNTSSGYSGVKRVVNTTPKVKATVAPVNLSYIVYFGTIKNIDKSVKLASLSIRNESVFMKQGDKIQDVELLKITNDSVMVKIEKKNYYIKRQKI